MKIKKSLVAVSLASFVIGSLGTYFFNKNKIDFANRYPLMWKTEKYMSDTLCLPKPDKDDKERVINAYLSLYGDKYTVFQSSDSMLSKENIIQDINSSSVALGSGFEVDFNKNDKLFFSKIEKGSFADEQGFEEGDVILKVNDTEIVDPVDARALKGKDGTEAVVLIDRKGFQIEMKFVRTSDPVAAAGIVKKRYGSALYIRLKDINMFLADPFEKALDGEMFDSVIFDLRDDPGGSTDVVTNILDPFIGEGVFEMHGKDGELYTKKTSVQKRYDVKIVVLVNEKTASAAEIITAMLKQYGDATIIGTQTFGKGIYQFQAQYEGGMLKYTDGYVTVGDWECYHGVGITPDIEIEMDSSLIGADDDIQLKKALEIIGEK